MPKEKKNTKYFEPIRLDTWKKINIFNYLLFFFLTKKPFVMGSPRGRVASATQEGALAVSHKPCGGWARNGDPQIQP